MVRKFNEYHQTKIDKDILNQTKNIFSDISDEFKYEFYKVFKFSRGQKFPDIKPDDRSGLGLVVKEVNRKCDSEIKFKNFLYTIKNFTQEVFKQSVGRRYSNVYIGDYFSNDVWIFVYKKTSLEKVDKREMINIFKSRTSFLFDENECRFDYQMFEGEVAYLVFAMEIAKYPNAEFEVPSNLPNHIYDLNNKKLYPR